MIIIITVFMSSENKIRQHATLASITADILSHSLCCSLFCIPLSLSGNEIDCWII